ncbi:AVN_HP_G0119710.mRNA.1.CDS.1 [Saccharomyces cerevisiae]|nr:AVN_HP_G0119710.mRNA.1.CDS.1 [Saccharomyces cerevisiae]CAI6996836.1 AVN_HP_G0119710.mRNA.1.CDS.1 [Saccharomyces cerevisiae]
MSLANSFTKNNSSTNYKYIKLLNLCAGVYPNCRFPDLQYLQNRFIRANVKLIEVVTIIELLKLFLLVDEKNCSDFNKSKFMEEEREVTETSHYQDFKMAESLEHIIVKISSKVLGPNKPQVYSEAKSIRPASPSSVKNDPFDNKGVDCTRAIPKKINISNMYASSLLSLALLLYLRYHYMIPGDRKLRNDATFKMFVLGLLKSNDVNIRCVA